LGGRRFHGDSDAAVPHLLHTTIRMLGAAAAIGEFPFIPAALGFGLAGKSLRDLDPVSALRF
jgi:hypothetical protein